MTLALAGRWLFVAGLLSTVSCAAGRIKRENSLTLAAADARTLEGCYDCLLRARETYERLAASKYVTRDTIALRRFETELLLTLREKELVLDWTHTFQRAASLASALPAAVDGRRLLALIDAVLPDGTGRVNDWPVEMRRARASFGSKVGAELSWLGSTPLRPAVREYIALAVDCSYDARVLAPGLQPGMTQRRPVLAPNASPLVIYRTGICIGADTNMLAAVRVMVPDFVEAAYFEATSTAVGHEYDGGEGAAALLRIAYARFPAVPGVTYMSGWLAEELGDCSVALGHFDETLAVDSTHELALLQSTICLSRLHRDSSVLGRATRLLTLGTGTTQQAYYWRALSHMRIGDLVSARRDIEAAKAIAPDANALTLGGIIENEQNDLAIAEQDLRAARALPRGEQNCTAAWTLGLVVGKSPRHPETAETFESAADCYDLKVAIIRARIARLKTHPPRNAAHAARRLAALETDSTEQRMRYYTSTFNAAGFRANAGNVTRARELLDIAARDPKLADAVAKMREAIRAVR